MILEQIKFSDRSALMAWSTRNFSDMNESKEFQGGFEFPVLGLIMQDGSKFILDM